MTDHATIRRTVQEALKAAFPQFRTKAALEAEVRRVLHSTPRNTKLSNSDDTMIRKLVEFHPDAAAKIGCGIASIQVGNGPFNAPSFWIFRTDGSTTDFSYRKCLNPAADTTRKETLAAMRHAVQPQIDEFRAACNAYGLEIHHAVPFTDLAASFLEAWEGEAPKIEPMRDGQLGDSLVAGPFRDRWAAYHAKQTVLEAVTTEQNRSAELARLADSSCPGCHGKLTTKIVGTKTIEGRRAKISVCSSCSALVFHLGATA